MIVNVPVNIPDWLIEPLVQIVILYRRLRYGYPFRRIPLTRGKFAVVDHEDYDRLSKLRWHAHDGRCTFYAVHSLTNGISQKRKNLHMHRLVIDVPQGGVCDHINRNGLDNRKANLRPATSTQNSCNRKSISHTSRFKGVSWNKLNRKWRAAVRKEGKNVHLGYYDDEIEAAKAYDKAARQLRGEFAVLNFPPPKTRRWRLLKFNVLSGLRWICTPLAEIKFAKFALLFSHGIIIMCRILRIR